MLEIRIGRGAGEKFWGGSKKGKWELGKEYEGKRRGSMRGS